MKLLVFAHTPPPHHGQSFMVQKMIEGFGGDQRKRENRKPNPYDIQCYHVNARVSKHLEDIGEFRVGKFLLMLWYCLQAIWCRFRYGVTNLYYVPAPGKSSALYRDWLVMALCRPFFKRVILHWHASGMAKWLETMTQIRSRALTYRFLGQADLSIVLSQYGRTDAEKLFPGSLVVVGNGIADPCPSFYTTVLPLRRARLHARETLLSGREISGDDLAACKRDPRICQALFLSHCGREKGLFETIEAVRLTNQELAKGGSKLQVRLTIAGTFLRSADRAEFDRLMQDAEVAAQVTYVGFASGKKKEELLQDADVFCFPSHLESFGLVLAEAMACGLPIVASNCGALPEVVLPEYPCLVPVGSAPDIANALQRALFMDLFEAHRQRYEQLFTVDRCIAQLAAAIKSAGNLASPAFPDWEHPPAELRPARMSS